MASAIQTPLLGYFQPLAEEENIPLVPFQFEELVVTKGMIQQDGIHPTELAQPIIKQAVLTEVRKILK